MFRYVNVHEALVMKKYNFLDLWPRDDPRLTHGTGDGRPSVPSIRRTLRNPSVIPAETTGTATPQTRQEY